MHLFIYIVTMNTLYYNSQQINGVLRLGGQGSGLWHMFCKAEKVLE